MCVAVFLRCEGRTALITGGTTGIGFETAKKLLSFGMNIIIGMYMCLFSFSIKKMYLC